MSPEPIGEGPDLADPDLSSQLAKTTATRSDSMESIDDRAQAQPCKCDEPKPAREDCVRYCGACGNELPQVGPKEALYDEHFSPLVAQLIALSKEHGVSLFVHCRLDGCPDSVTTSCPQPEDDEWARGFLRWTHPPQFAAYTITTVGPKS